MEASADDLPPVKRTNSIEWLPPDLSALRTGVRIILIGPVGSGKSSTINTIIGREEFEVSGNQRSVTKRSQRAETEVDGRRVSVVDTPGLFSDSLSHDEVHDEMIKSISLLDPGPNAFLLVSNINHFTEEDGKTLEQIREVFGRAAERFTIVLFTGGDKLKSTNMTIEEFTENDCPDFMKKLIQDCGGRYHVFDNQDEGNRSQVSELITKIEDMLQANGGGFYSREMLQKRQEGEDIRRIVREEVREEMENLQRQNKELKEMMKRIEDKIFRNEERAQKPKQPEETENISRENQEWIQIINNMKQKIKADSESKKAIQKELEEAREELKRERENWKKREKELWRDRFQETEQMRKEAEMEMKKLQEEYAEERKSIERRREEEERKRKEEEEEALKETRDL